MKDETFFDDQIRQNALKHEAEVPADAWDNIMQKPKKRRGLIWWLVPASLLLAGFGYWYFQPSQSNRSVAKMSEKVTTVNGDKTQTTSSKTDISTNYNNSQEKNHEELTGIGELSLTDEPQARITASNSGTNNKSKSNKTSNRISSNSKVSKSTGNNSKGLNKISSNNIISNSTGHNSNGSNKSNANSKINQLVEISISSNLKASEQATAQKENENQLQPSSNNSIAQVQASPNQLISIGNSNNKAKGSNNSINPASGNAKEMIASQKIEDSANALVLTTSKSFEIGQGVAGSNNEQKQIQIPKPSRWFIDFSSGALFSFSNRGKQIDLRRITELPNAILNFTPETIQVKQESGLAIRLGLRKMVSDKWGVGTGIQYQEINERIKMTGTETQISNVVVQRLIGSGGNGLLIADSFNTSTSGIRTIDARNKYQLLSVPIYVHYRVFKHTKSSIDIYGGAVLNFASKYQNSINGAFKTSGDSTKQKRAGLDFYASIRYTRRLNNNLNLFMAPGIYLNVAPNKLPGMITASPFSRAAINIGFSYQLKK